MVVYLSTVVPLTRSVRVLKCTHRMPRQTEKAPLLNKGWFFHGAPLGKEGRSHFREGCTLSTSYLASVKEELRAIFDEAFSFVWKEAEKALKQSYKNGFQDGSKSTGNTPKNSRRSWKRTETQEDSE